MIYKIYIMTNAGYKKLSDNILSLGYLFQILDHIIEINETRQLLVIEKDIDLQSDNIFFLYQGNIEEYQKFKESKIDNITKRKR